MSTISPHQRKDSLHILASPVAAAGSSPLVRTTAATASSPQSSAQTTKSPNNNAPVVSNANSSSSSSTMSKSTKMSLLKKRKLKNSKSSLGDGGEDLRVTFQNQQMSRLQHQEVPASASAALESSSRQHVLQTLGSPVSAASDAVLSRYGNSNSSNGRIKSAQSAPVFPSSALQSASTIGSITTPNPNAFSATNSPTNSAAAITLMHHRIQRVEDLSVHLNRRLPKPVTNLTLCIQHLKILLQLTKNELSVYIKFAELSQCLTHLNASLYSLEEFLESIMNASVLLKARFNKPLKKLTKSLEQNVVMFGMTASYLKASVAVDAVRRLSVVSGFPQFDLIDTSDTHALVTQADSHYFGHGVVQDYHAAYRLYMSAADNGHPRAQFIVGKMSLEGVGVDSEGDGVQETGVRFILKACEQEYADALNYMGFLHSEGKYDRVPKDDRLAVKYFFKAAKAGHLEGMCHLAQHLLEGIGVKKDAQQAVQWLRKAADKNFPRALNQLGRLYYQGAHGLVERNYTQAVDLFKRAAEQNYPNSLNSLGVAYEEGKGVLRDLDMAAKFYERAKELGNANAYNNLGYVRLLQKQFLEGKQLLMAAADRGSIDALHNLGLIYLQGLGVSVDVPRAFQYFSKASESNHYRSCTRAADILFSGTANGEVPADRKRAYELYYKAATEGNDADAQNSVGILFEEGLVVKKDPKEAFKWYQLAVKSSQRRHAQAIFNLAALYASGSGCKKNPARSIALYEEAARLGHLKAKEIIMTAGKGQHHHNEQPAASTPVKAKRRTRAEEPALDDDAPFVSPIRRTKHAKLDDEL